MENIENVITLQTKAQLREKILKLESVMLEMKDKQIHIEPIHHFAPGLYLREITIPKDVTLTGLIHKTEHICILSKGKVSVSTEDGIKTLEASSVVHSMPGAKRVLYAHEDSVWINVHFNPTNESDISKIDDLYTVSTFEALEEFQKLKIEEKK